MLLTRIPTDIWNAITGSPESVLIPTFTVALTVIAQYLKDRCIAKRNNEEQMQRLKDALRTELQTLVNIYGPVQVGFFPPRQGQDIKTLNISYTDYITVYRGNADKLGMLDACTASAVVVAYTHIAALFDYLNAYSERWERMVNSGRQGKNFVRALDMKDVAAAYEDAFRQQAVTLAAMYRASELLRKTK